MSGHYHYDVILHIATLKKTDNNMTNMPGPRQSKSCATSGQSCIERGVCKDTEKELFIFHDILG